jgi:hypothetical protein
MPEAFIESGEEEALDCFQQEEAGPFFVASPLLTSEGNNEGNNMNSGKYAHLCAVFTVQSLTPLTHTEEKLTARLCQVT